MEAMALGRLDFDRLVVFGADRYDPAQGSTENIRNERFRSKAFQQKIISEKYCLSFENDAVKYVFGEFIEFQSGF